MQETSGALGALSSELTSAVARIAPSVVYVDADRRRDASGFAWTERLVVTADHAVDREDDLELVLPDGSRVQAELAGRDPSTDLAVLRSAVPLPPAPRATEAALAPGNLVLAVARDEDGATSASFGIISVASEGWRTRRGGEIERYVRPDLSIYPGFSGGPLVDARGAVLGLNTWGLSRRWALTLPLETIGRVAEAIERNGRIVRGYLGIATQPVRLPATLRAALSLENEGGAIVVDVADGAPAEGAGIAIGDVIVAIGDRAIEDAGDIQRALGAATVGTEHRLRIVRGGEPREIAVTLGERPRA